MIYKSMDRRSYIFVALLSWAFLLVFPKYSVAQNPKVFPVVDKMYANREVKKPTSIEEWKSDEKNIPKDFRKLKNKNFSVIYPSCIELTAGGDEEGDGATGSPSVTFIAGDKCGPKVKTENIKSITIGLLFYENLSKLEDASVEGKLLLKKNININGVPATYFSSVVDSCTNDGCFPELRNHIILICNKKTFRISASVTSGDISKNLIDKDNYDLPETYKTMASSFRCSKPRK